MVEKNNGDTTARLSKSTHGLLGILKDKTGKPIKRLISEAIKEYYVKNVLGDSK